MKQIIYTIGLFLVITVGHAQDAEHYLNLAKQELYNNNCHAAQSFYYVYKRLSQDSIPSLEAQIKECLNPKKSDNSSKRMEGGNKIVGEKNEVTHKLRSKPKEESKFVSLWKDRDNPYCEDGRNEYFAWAIASAGFPWKVTSGVELRGGGILGIGGYADIGVDFSRFSVKYIINDYYDYDFNHNSDNYDDSKAHTISNLQKRVYFSYIGGVRVFYKGLFLSLGYGSISREMKPVTFECDYVNYRDIEQQEQRDEYLVKIGHGHGLHFHVGYNLRYDLFFLGVSGGIAYDVVNKIIYPSFNLKLGMSFDWPEY